MKTARYFREQMLRKTLHPNRVVRTDSGQTSCAGYASGRENPAVGVVPEFGNRVLRIVTLADGETVHNAFPDRDFRATP